MRLYIRTVDPSRHQVAPYCPGELDQLQHRPLGNETSDCTHLSVGKGYSSTNGKSTDRGGRERYKDDDQWAQALSERAASQSQERAVAKQPQEDQAAPAAVKKSRAPYAPGSDLKRDGGQGSSMSPMASKSTVQKRWAPRSPETPLLTPPLTRSQGGGLQPGSSNGISAHPVDATLRAQQDVSPQRSAQRGSPVQSLRRSDGSRGPGGGPTDDLCDRCVLPARKMEIIARPGC